MTGNVRDNCYPHIRLLPTHPHLASADFVRLLPVATSAHPQIRFLPIAEKNIQAVGVGLKQRTVKRSQFVHTLQPILTA